jgi:hypothetical protein
VLTDHDPSGLVIGEQIERDVRGVEVVRLGMTPDLATEKTPTSEGIAEKPDSSHEKTDVWHEAVERWGDVRYQVEALDYATWAKVIAKAIARRLAAEQPDDDGPWTLDRLQSALTDRRQAFERGDELLGELSGLVDEIEDDEPDDLIGELAERLGLDVSGADDEENES